MADLPAPKTGFIAAHFITVSDIKRSTHFYRDILGGEVALEGEPTYVRLANTYVILNVGGGPTDDKPNTILRPPADMREVSRVLKPGGMLIIIAEIYKGVNTKTAKLAEKYLPMSGMKLLSVDEHRELFANAAYSDIQIIEESGKGWICATGRKAFE